eukprot:scaffold16330_cov172-Amphora_coffeaeformis.AAC.17
MEDSPLEYTISSEYKVETVLQDEKKEEGSLSSREEPVEYDSPPPSPQPPEQHPGDAPKTAAAETEDSFAEQVAQRTEPLVKFGNVMVREYERVIDSTQIYMGLALGWDFNDHEPAPLLDNPKGGGITKKAVEGSRGGEHSRIKRTNGSDRYGMLLRYGYAQKELRKATNEAAKFYEQRQKEVQRDAARSLVVADERKKNQGGKSQQRRPLFGSMFRR